MYHKTPVEVCVLGGAEEIGANCTYFNIGGTGILIDAGLHPRRTDNSAFPDFALLGDKPVDYLVLTHTHTDHLGALPLLLKYQPHIKILSSRATRDLSGVMLADTVKLMKRVIFPDFPKELLSLYDKKTLKKVDLLIKDVAIGEPVELQGMRPGSKPVTMTLFTAGHILGAVSVLLESEGTSLFITGDVQFRDQALIAKADLPRHHCDLLLLEATHGAEESSPALADEQKRLGDFINTITNAGGSVLVPTFALGRSQELLTIIHNLMRKGAIPQLPIYTGGMMKQISSLYDKYCYTTPRMEPGFEIGDIEQVDLDFKKIPDGPFLRNPSIVVVTSGMLNPGTASFRLCSPWFARKKFGIALVGYQDPDSPGYALEHSEMGKEFLFGNSKVKRKCKLEKFRFSAHSPREHLIDFATTMKPKSLFLHHGDLEALETMGRLLRERLPATRIYIPRHGVSYYPLE